MANGTPPLTDLQAEKLRGYLTDLLVIRAYVAAAWDINHDDDLGEALGQLNAGSQSLKAYLSKGGGL